MELGYLKIEDSARRWLPDVDIPNAITVTHLLRHTSGLGDYGSLPEYHIPFARTPTSRGRDNSSSTRCCRKAIFLHQGKGFRIRTSATCC